MLRTKNSSDAFTGLEAAIVLIAFVVVAAVFSYVVLGAGFFTTQKSQETVYKGVEQSTSNLQMVGNVYGTATTPANGIDQLQFNLGLAPGAPSIDLTKMIIVVSQPGTSSVTQLSYTAATTPTATSFAVLNASESGSTLGTLSGQAKAVVLVKISPELQKNNVINLQINPPVGASLPMSRTAPSTIDSSQILY